MATVLPQFSQHGDMIRLELDEVRPEHCEVEEAALNGLSATGTAAKVKQSATPRYNNRSVPTSTKCATFRQSQQ
jgi:hypothetical protein